MQMEWQIVLSLIRLLFKDFYCTPYEQDHSYVVSLVCFGMVVQIFRVNVVSVSVLF